MASIKKSSSKATLQVLQTYFHINHYICPLQDKSIKGTSMLGEKLKELRESKGLLQRQVAAELDVDTAYISKMENNDKPVSKANLSKLAKLYDVDEQELLTLWLADKVYDVVKDQDVALKAMEVAEEEIKSKRKEKN